MLGAKTMKRAIHAALEHRPEAFNPVGVRHAVHVFLHADLHLCPTRKQLYQLYQQAGVFLNQQPR